VSDVDDRADGESIKDAEDIVIERRLKTIFDIRERLHDLRTKFRLGQIDEMTETEALSGYRTLCDNYLMEIQPLLLKFDKGQELLNDHDFGAATVAPVVVKRELSHDTRMQLKFGNYGRENRTPMTIQGAPDPRVKEFELTGLRSLWEMDDPLRARFSVPTLDAGTQATMPEEVWVTDQIGFDPLDRMVRQMNVFLSEIGFELEPDRDDADRVAEYDYSDLI
jgi:hypothetical protein